MRSYLEISISGNPSQREILIPTLVELGCQGFEETESALKCYFDKSRWTEEDYQQFQGRLKLLIQHISSNAEVQSREIVDQNWNEQWEQTIQPIEITDRIVVKPTWTTYGPKTNQIVIEIDPKMSFGTGYHESTRLVLRLLDTYVTQNSVMLDVGTGTGILAITAIKLGARSAIGTDIDEWALVNALENVSINDVADRVQIIDQPLSSFPSGSHTLLAANLTLNSNLELLDEFHRLLQTGGMLLLAGLLRPDRDRMIIGLSRYPFAIAHELSENEWIAIAARKLQ